MNTATARSCVTRPQGVWEKSVNILMDLRDVLDAKQIPVLQVRKCDINGSYRKIESASRRDDVKRRPTCGVRGQKCTLLRHEQLVRETVCAI